MNELAPPVVDGWFTVQPELSLVGQRCEACGTVVFPPRAVACPSPTCREQCLSTTPLSRRGTIWSYATNHYPPPPPYVAEQPFEPVTIGAVELAAERLIVLGRIVGDPAELSVGREVELSVGTLPDGDGRQRTMWQWRLVGRRSSS